jgi:hypothetical protein
MTNIYQVGGTLAPDYPYYIEREADRQLYQALKQGEFCSVLSSRQMGKSSLWTRTENKLIPAGFKCAYIDLTRLGKPDSEETWYKLLYYELSKIFNLSISEQRRDWWDARNDLAPLNRFDEFIEEILLQEITSQIIICLDEIDSVLSLSFPPDDFFTWIRSCYNQRSTKPIYKRLTFCIIGVASAADLIRDNARTPFNIGQQIYLRGFRKVEAQPLIQGLREKVSDPERVVEEILDWTEGQPFLTQKLCKLIYESRVKIFLPNQLDVRDFVRSKIIDNWESQDDPIHFRNLQNRLLDKRLDTKKLLESYQKILKDGEIDYDSTQELIYLRLTGLVAVENSKLKVYNRIYREIFNKAWVKHKLNQGSSRTSLNSPQANYQTTIKQIILNSLLGVSSILALGAILRIITIPSWHSTLEKCSGECLIFADSSNKELQIKELQKSIKLFEQGKYADTAESFPQQFSSLSRPPELLIYENNALARSRGKAIKIAVIISQENREDSQEILRGVADAQKRFNELGHKDTFLEVVIVNEDSLKFDNSPEGTRSREFLRKISREISR